VDNDSKIVTGRKTNYCDNRTNDCDDYMKCEDGACTTVTIDRKYFINKKKKKKFNIYISIIFFCYFIFLLKKRESNQKEFIIKIKIYFYSIYILKKIT